jgi:hypothetical protein
VSLPITINGARPSFSLSRVARETPTVSSVAAFSGNLPASPRMPSVPKSLFVKIEKGKRWWSY